MTDERDERPETAADAPETLHAVPGPPRGRTPRVDVGKARRDILAGLHADFGDAVVDAVLLESAARHLARARQVSSLIDRLPPEDGLLARTARGTTVHPYLGHERDLRAQLRSDLLAIRASLGGGSVIRPSPAHWNRPGSIADELGPPARRPLLLD